MTAPGPQQEAAEEWPVPPTRQIAFAVRDLERSLSAFDDLFGAGPWNIYTLGPERLSEMEYRGRKVEFRFRHALTTWGPVQLELVQPLSGPNVYTEHLERHGEGVQHLGTYVEDIGRTRQELEARGWTLVQWGSGFGRTGDGAFAYFETPAFGTLVEIIHAPTVRHDPDLVWPRRSG